MTETYGLAKMTRAATRLDEQRTRPESRREHCAPPPPGPRGLPVVGVLPKIWRDPLGFFRAVEAEFGGLARFGNRKFTLFLLSDPDAIRAVLRDHAGVYWKGEGLAAARTVMGDGLATSHGPHWQRQRRRIQPAFARNRLGSLVPMIERATDAMLDGWDERAARGEPHDIRADVSDLVQNLIFRGLFGADCDDLDTASLGRALATANEHIHRSAWALVKPPAWVPTPHRVRFRRAMHTLDATLGELIASRRSDAATRDDVLGRLLDASGSDDGGMTDKQLRDEIMTLFVAGHDTTAAAIAWTLHLLGVHRMAGDRVATEGATAGDERPFTRCVVQESMRLYPPGWIIVRTPRTDTELCGFAVPRAAPILISPWVVHRSARHWDDPDAFRPERFDSAQTRAGEVRAFFPYGAGSRVCVGRAFADLIIHSVVARAAARFAFEPAGAELPNPVPRTTLQPDGRSRLRLERR